jgi:hypothetical protein
VGIQEHWFMADHTGGIARARQNSLARLRKDEKNFVLHFLDPSPVGKFNLKAF